MEDIVEGRVISFSTEMPRRGLAETASGMQVELTANCMRARLSSSGTGHTYFELGVQLPLPTVGDRVFMVVSEGRDDTRLAIHWARE